MDIYIQTILFYTLICSASCQYHAQYRSGAPPSASGPTIQPAPSNPIRLSYPEPSSSSSQAYEEPSRPKIPRPLILTHQQTQTHDGGFKYAFAADNGLQQGETISPDGTRTGAYSYVDPHGKQITVKYTAGKDGFRIIEGPHKSPDSAPHQESQAQQSYQTQPAYQQQQRYQHENQYFQPIDGYSGPQTFNNPQHDNSRYTHAFHRGVVLPAATTAQPIAAPVPRYLTYKPSQHTEETSQSNNAIQQEPEYNDEPGKPNSFGNGYSFEFSG